MDNFLLKIKLCTRKTAFGYKTRHYLLIFHEHHKYADLYKCLQTEAGEIKSLFVLPN